MLYQIAIIAALLPHVGPSQTGHVAISKASVSGAWECGPTSMNGPQFAMTVVISTKRAIDGTFVSTTTSVITPSDKPAITMTNTASGTWKLEGAILVSTFSESKFVSASDPTISAEFGQKIQDDQLRIKTVYRNRILELKETMLRSIPVESEFAEAVVESTCRRT